MNGRTQTARASTNPTRAHHDTQGADLAGWGQRAGCAGSLFVAAFFWAGWWIITS